jgi:hypothetical protein
VACKFEIGGIAGRYDSWLKLGVNRPEKVFVAWHPAWQ